MENIYATELIVLLDEKINKGTFYTVEIKQDIDVVPLMDFLGK